MMDYHALRDRPVFICGHPKSGTSLLRSLLDSHPALVVYPEETLFFRRYMKKAAGQPLRRQLELAGECLLHIFTWNTNDPPVSQAGYPDRDYSQFSFDMVRDQMEALLTESPPRHDGDILAAVVLAFGLAAGCNIESTGRWVEKSPYNEFYARQIFSNWPEAKCIHIIRDPRDNYVSYKRKQKDWTAEFFAANWVRSTKAGYKHSKEFGPDRYWAIRFEDLTTKQLAKYDMLIGADICFWDELVKPVSNMVKRAVKAGVKKIIIADPQREPFFEVAERCQKRHYAEVLEWEVNSPITAEGALLIIENA